MDMNQNQGYQAPPNQLNQYGPQQEVMTMGQWFLTIFLIGIPIVGLILLLVWAFSSNTNPNKKTFAQAWLIWTVIGIVLSFVFYATAFSAIMAVMDGMGGAVPY